MFCSYGASSAVTGIPCGRTLARWPGAMADTTAHQGFISLIRGNRVEERRGMKGFEAFGQEV